MLSPIKGHGWNPVEELFGCSIISTVTFENDEGGEFPIDISFRQIGLLVDPTLYGTSTIADLSGAKKQYTTLNVSGLSGTLVESEILNDTTSGLPGVAQVIKVESNKVYVNVVKGQISANDQLQGTTSGTTFEVLTVVPPILQDYSGDMIYLENRPAITKIENQSETYRLVIEF